MTGVQAQPDVRDLEQALDLPLRLDERRRVVVEGRLEAAVSAAFHRDRQPDREPPPAGVVETDRGVECRPAGQRRARRRARIGERRPRRPVVAAGEVEQVEQLVELAERGLEPGGLAERQLEVAAGEAEPPLGQPRREQIAGAEISRRTEIDPDVSGRRHRVEQRYRIGNVRVDADRDLERAVADRSIGDPHTGGARSLVFGDRHGRRLPMRRHSTPVSIRDAPSRLADPGARAACVRAIASASRMSRRPSSPEVRGSRPLRMQSENSTSSRLNASS